MHRWKRQRRPGSTSCLAARSAACLDPTVRIGSATSRPVGPTDRIAEFRISTTGRIKLVRRAACTPATTTPRRSCSAAVGVTHRSVLAWSPQWHASPFAILRLLVISGSFSERLLVTAQRIPSITPGTGASDGTSTLSTLRWQSWRLLLARDIGSCMRRHHTAKSTRLHSTYSANTICVSTTSTRPASIAGNEVTSTSQILPAQVYVPTGRHETPAFGAFALRLFSVLQST